MQSEIHAVSHLSQPYLPLFPFPQPPHHDHTFPSKDPDLYLRLRDEGFHDERPTLRRLIGLSSLFLVGFLLRLLRLLIGTSLSSSPASVL